MASSIGRLLLRKLPSHRSCSTSTAGSSILPKQYVLCSKRRIYLCPILKGKIVQFNLSDIGEGIAEVEVKEWFVKEGDKISEFENLCEVQSDKASVTITSRFSGVIKKLHHNLNDIANVGKPLVDIELATDDGEAEEDGSSTSSASSSDDEETIPNPPPTSPPTTSPPDNRPSMRQVPRKALASPAVRRMAKEKNVDISQVEASGKFGHVLKEDIMKFLAGAGVQSSASDFASPAAQPALPDPKVLPGVDKTVPIRGYGRIMVKTMAQANLIPHFGYCDEVCVDRLVELRKELKAIATERGVKMSYMPIFIKAASLALHDFPILNASLDSAVENVTYRASHNVCVAMDTPGGLVVPNIKHCEQKNLWDIAADLNRLHEAGKKGNIAQSDLSDGTFTLSNIGSIGGTYAHPVIFPPQVAIGALGKIQVEPRFDRNGAVFASNLVRVSWSADHRVIDGATMARFSNAWKRYLENPGLMIATMK